MEVVRPRRLVVTAAAAAVVAAAVTLTIVHETAVNKHAVKPPKITVASLNERAVAGVIAAGTINGKRWRIRLTQSRDNSCWARPHLGWAPGSNCIEGVGYRLAHWPAFTGPAAFWNYSPAIYGPVKPNVALVTMRLTSGAVLNLHPVEAFGRRWVGIVLPAGLVPAEVVAYSRHSAIAHSVAYTGAGVGRPGPGIEFLSWLPPGDGGPRRATKVIRGGGWTMVLHAGPWGNVVTDASGGFSLPLGDRPSGVLEGNCGLPRTLVMAFPGPAAYIELVLSDGSTRRVPLVRGAGVGFAIIRAASKPGIVTWAVRDSAGRRLTGGSGPPGGC